MFQHLRPNSTLYILHRGNTPCLEYGQVVSISPIRTVYKTMPNTNFPQTVQVVDIVVNINGNNVNLQEIPANMEIADDPRSGMLISASREEMNTEIITMKQKSEDVLRSVEYHKNFLASCDQMLSVLNPEIAAKQQQDKEIAQMKKQIETMSQSVQSLIELNKKLMHQVGINGTETEKNK